MCEMPGLWIVITVGYVSRHKESLQITVIVIYTGTNVKTSSVVHMYVSIRVLSEEFSITIPLCRLSWIHCEVTEYLAFRTIYYTDPWRVSTS